MKKELPKNTYIICRQSLIWSREKHACDTIGVADTDTEIIGYTHDDNFDLYDYVNRVLSAVKRIHFFAWMISNNEAENYRKENGTEAVYEALSRIRNNHMRNYLDVHLTDDVDLPWGVNYRSIREVGPNYFIVTPDESEDGFNHVLRFYVVKLWPGMEI